MSTKSASKIDMMIALLKIEFNKMERIDPCSDKVLRMRDLLKKLDREHLQKIIDAEIKFLRVMAQTELISRKGK